MVWANMGVGISYHEVMNSLRFLGSMALVVPVVLLVGCDDPAPNEPSPRPSSIFVTQTPLPTVPPTIMCDPGPCVTPSEESTPDVSIPVWTEFPELTPLPDSR